MTAAFNIIRTDIADHVNGGFPLEAYGSARAFSALIESGIDPYELDCSMGEIIRAVLAKACLEALAA
jgi:hypothetical protein